MRDDMKKVVTERPRSGIRFKTPKGYNRQMDRYGEDSPKREKIRLKWRQVGYNKEFTDVIGPLYRFLLKQVGRPWDKVYSEITQKLPKGTVTNDHIYTHVFQFVERDVEIVDGECCHKGHTIHGRPIRSSGTYVQMFVHPTTGILCKAKKGKSPYAFDMPKTHEAGIAVYPGCQYHKVDGIWYEVKVREYIPVPLSFGYNVVHDVIMNRYIPDSKELKRIYHGLYIAESKRRLTKKEMKFACLS